MKNIASDSTHAITDIPDDRTGEQERYQRTKDQRIETALGALAAIAVLHLMPSQGFGFDATPAPKNVQLIFGKDEEIVIPGDKLQLAVDQMLHEDPEDPEVELPDRGNH